MDRTEFASRIGIQETTLERLSTRAHRCYVSYYRLKKDGAGRPIDAPNIELKGIQSFILREILEKFPTHDSVHGFRKERGVRTNARRHLKNQHFLCVDIKSFFHSVTFEQVNGVFQGIVQDTFLSEMLTRICTLNRRLPQGGVTSPYLSNLVLLNTDEKVSEYCRSRRIIYTRYADDLTFSASDKPRLVELLVELERLLRSEGFELNQKKTRFMSGARKISITGLTLNSKRLSIGRVRKKNLRAALFQLAKGRLPDESVGPTIGMLSFLKDIEPEKYRGLKETFIKNKARFARPDPSSN